MKVSGFWSLLGAVVMAGIIVDLVTHASGTTAAFNGVTGLTKATGNIVTGA